MGILMPRVFLVGQRQRASEGVYPEAPRQFAGGPRGGVLIPERDTARPVADANYSRCSITDTVPSSVLVT